MRSIIFAVFFVLTFFCFSLPCSAAESEIDYARISVLFFPDTVAWQLVSEMHRATPAFLQNVEQAMRNGYADSRISRAHESGDCSFIDRVLSREWNRDGKFYLYDVDADGSQDILYTGSTLCAEGDSTLVWFGRRGEPTYEIRQNVLWPMRALRVQQGQPAGIASVSTGCCGSSTDEYFFGTLESMRRGGGVSITAKTELPRQTGTVLPFITAREMILRSAPLQEDAYAQDASGLADVAVFGNILSRYLPGCSGELRGKQGGQKDDSWCFVVLSRECNPLRSHAPYDVHAGWTNCDVLKMK